MSIKTKNMKKTNKFLLELYKDKNQIFFLGFLIYIDLIINSLIPSNTDVYQGSFGIIAVSAIVVGGGIAAYGIASGNKRYNDALEAAQDNNDLSALIAAEQLEFQKEQQAALDKQKNVYRSFVFKNPYENMENVFEDLRVNHMQAQFEATQGQQMRADILQNLRSAAGSSGIAGLAQILANQSQVQIARSSASIGAQESQLQLMRAKGASAADMAERGGEAMVQQMEADRQATLLGIQMGQTSGANAALQQAYSNQIASGAAMANMMGQSAASLYGVAGAGIGLAGSAIQGYGAYKGSDKKLKKNINIIGKSKSGLNIYSFEYIDSKYGSGLFQGVMSDEVPQHVVTNINGYDHVNYDLLDVEFKQI